MIVLMSDQPSSITTESSRVEAFSDGVLAIALTLLVLNLHSDAARGDFGHQLADQWPSYVAYLAAFCGGGSRAPSTHSSPSTDTCSRTSSTKGRIPSR
jgi:hypothetical protein